MSPYRENAYTQVSSSKARKLRCLIGWHRFATDSRYYLRTTEELGIGDRILSRTGDYHEFSVCVFCGKCRLGVVVIGTYWDWKTMGEGSSLYFTGEISYEEYHQRPLRTVVGETIVDHWL